MTKITSNGLGRGQDSLCLDPSLDLLMQPFDRVGGARAAPLHCRQSREGEELVPGFFQAVGDGPARATECYKFSFNAPSLFRYPLTDDGINPARSARRASRDIEVRRGDFTASALQSE